MPQCMVFGAVDYEGLGKGKFSGNVIYDRRKVSSDLEHTSANAKVPGSIPSPVSYWGHGL